MTRYIITTRKDITGGTRAWLSLPGSWGNIPFDSEEDAAAYARRDAGGKPVEIEREAIRAPRR